MTNTLESPETKKKLLLTLIDDMTAAAIDRTSQSHILFIDLRSQLITLIDRYAEEEREHIDAVKAAMKCLNEVKPHFAYK
jgi:hypothetical protein